MPKAGLGHGVKLSWTLKLIVFFLLNTNTVEIYLDVCCQRQVSRL